ncbi:hypothetical protein BDV06DRAFT_184091 [Aspergillus oleicola]
MGLSQPTVTPLPVGLNLRDKTAIITGATSGLGLETARQLLQLNVSTLILAVRNKDKAKDCVEGLLCDPVVKERKTTPEIRIMGLDMESYPSVKTFTAQVKAEVQRVDYLVLNAGINAFTFSTSPPGHGQGHEKTMQVNYLSNALLITELLDFLYSLAERTGTPTRVTWLGSRTYYIANSIEKSQILACKDGVLGYMDKQGNAKMMYRYADSKMLCAFFVYELSKRLDTSKVQLNLACPGMVKTELSGDGPLLVRILIRVLQALRAREVSVGGVLVLNAIVLAGKESHGKLLGDKEVTEPSEWMQSADGQELQRRLWGETIEEMKGLTTLPAVMA